MRGKGSVDVVHLSDSDAAERMAAAGRGDAVAFSTLCECYGPLLLGMALRVLGARPAAEAAVFSVLLEAWRGARSFAPTHFSVRIWWTIGVRTAALRARPEHRATRMASMYDTQITTIESESEAVEVVALRQAVQSAMLDLGDEARSALQAAYFEGLTAEEIAARSEGTAEAVREQVAEGLVCFATALGTSLAQVQLGASYLLGELSPEDMSRFDLGEALGGFSGDEVATLRNVVHGVALYTFPAPLMPQTRARLLATITGPERLSPFAEELGELLRLNAQEVRELLGRVDAPHGWRDDGSKIRVLAIGSAEDPVLDNMLDEEVDFAVTMVQRPAWPKECLVRVAPKALVPSRFPHSEARVLVLQGRLKRSEGEARAGDLLFWRPGTSLGVAVSEGPELLLAVSAGLARTWRA